jgi:hypothetical protein
VVLSGGRGILRGMSAGKVVIVGRFPAGNVVHLWRVADEGVLRHEGGELVDTKRVDVDGVVTFRSRVAVGGRFIAYGYVDGQPESVRCRGLAADEVAEVLGQAPVGREVVKHADGQVVDGVYRPLRYASDEPGSDEEPEPVPAEELRGEALSARVAELGIEGASSMSADEKRAAVAAREAELNVGAGA